MNVENRSAQSPAPIPVLIVEDSVTQAELLRRVLAREGYRVIVARDGVEGLMAARREQPRVIVSDINMPRMDGFEMCQAIREDGALGRTPVILLTMLSDAKDVIRGLNAGADYYVTKPFDEHYLLAKIRAALTGISWHGEEKQALELEIGTERHSIRAGPQQIMNLLVSTYENAVLQNHELISAQDQLQQLSLRLEEKAQKLEETNKDLESFAYSVSHDLRVPLRAIDGFSSIVIEKYQGVLDEEGVRLLNVVRDNAKRMAQLIESILSFSRTGRAEMSPATLDMEGLVRALIEELRPAFADRDLAVEIKPLPAVRGDQILLRQVWMNLLVNAIKFTRLKPKAQIEVGGRSEGGEQVYYVKDNGAGFDMEHAGRLFGVFQRLPGVEAFEGSGIGLAIVKRIITRHGGRVWAEGRVGEGATFYFALPQPGPGAES